MNSNRLQQLVYVAALVLLALVSKKCYDDGQRRLGALQERLRYTTDSLKQERELARLLENAHRVDTVRLTRTLRRWDTVAVVRDSLLTLHDTVRVPVEVFRPVLVASDSVRNACLTALGSCEAISQNLKTRLTLTEQQRDVYKAQRPSFVSTWFWRGAAFGLGYVVGGGVKR